MIECIYDIILSSFFLEGFLFFLKGEYILCEQKDGKQGINLEHPYM